MATLHQLTETCSHVMSEIGDPSMRAVGARLLREYRDLPPESRAEFFGHLVQAYGIDEGRMDAAYAAWTDARADPNRAAAAEIELVEAAEPRRQQLFRRINHAPGATFALTELRSELRALLPEHPQLRAVDHDLRHLLGSWFNRGFLRMAEVTWDSPGELLDHLIDYEQVHAMSGLDELRRRLHPADRRIYAFFHPATGNRPLIFVEVALTHGVPHSISPILKPGPELDPAEADAAVLYSISNSLDGLAGISFGNLLIKQVIEEVGAALPHLRTFVTLSPLPGFRRWLNAQADDATARLNESLEALDQLPVWDDATVELLAPEVHDALARYVGLGRDHRGRPLDPVARFHLSNGAQAWRLNWPADFSAKGRKEAFGAMINYRYEPAELERRHEDHLRHNIIALSPEISSALNRPRGKEALA